MGDVAKIDKGVAMPMADRSSYPFAAMEIGDSFKVIGIVVGRTRAAASDYGKRHNKAFSILQYEGAYRCWRIG